MSNSAITGPEKIQVLGALRDVGAFMYAFKQPTPIGFINAAINKFPLRAALLEEEFLEFLEAKDRIGQLDAVCDILYIAAGNFITCGFRYKEFDNYAFAKPLPRAVAEARRAFIVQPCEKGLRLSGASLLLTIVRAGRSMFKRYAEAFNAVHENNMSKMWTAEEVASQTEYKAEERPIATPDGRRFIMTNKAGKIMKPPGFKPVDLTPYV